MLIVNTSLAIGEPLQIGEAVVIPRGIRGGRVMLEIHTGGCRVCKPELEARILKEMAHLRTHDEGEVD